MRNEDKRRKWMWWFLGTVAALQLYFVRELLAAFALFAVAFAVIAFLGARLYMLQSGWAVAVQRLAESRQPVMAAVRPGRHALEVSARRAVRRPVGEPAT